MGWGDRSVRRGHVHLVAWIWHTVVPIAYGVDREVVAATWEMFKSDPHTEDEAVSSMKSLTNAIWLSYVEMN
jgi:hypothetical protein